MPTIYYEAGLTASLIPVQFLGYAKTPAHDVTGCFNVVVRLKRSNGAYTRGDILHLPAWCIVEKAGRRDYKQLVRLATLPARTTNNTVEARQ